MTSDDYAVVENASTVSQEHKAITPPGRSMRAQFRIKRSFSNKCSLHSMLQIASKLSVPRSNSLASSTTKRTRLLNPNDRARFSARRFWTGLIVIPKTEQLSLRASQNDDQPRQQPTSTT